MTTLVSRISRLATRMANHIRDNIVPRLLPSGGTSGQVLAKSSANDYAVGWISPSAGADPWTRVGLASDFVNATITFTDITGFTFTPPANTTWTVEAEVLIETVATANMPRLGASIGAGQQWWAAEIGFQAGAAAKSFVEGQGTTGAGTVQVPAGTAPVQAIPFLHTVTIKGRSGSTPGAIKLQLAAESAIANGAIARRGSEFRSRTGP
jgi:hypothetical protein